MPFPDNMIRVSFAFKWEYSGTPEEIQDTSVWVHALAPSIPLDFDWQPVLDDLANHCAGLWVGNMDAHQFSPAVFGNVVKTYFYAHDGSVAADKVGTAAFTGDNAWAGGGGGSGLPPENTIVGTLYAYTPGQYAPQRARKRGRMYLPTPSVQMIDTYGIVPAGQQGTLATNFAALIFGIGTYIWSGDDGPVSFIPVVRSVAGRNTNAVQKIGVGKIIDTQRRRRNKLAETPVIKP